jgi:hypothetical protein
MFEIEAAENLTADSFDGEGVRSRDDEGRVRLATASV